MPSQPETGGLAALQRQVAAAIMRPLTPDDRMQSRWEDGRDTSEVVEGMIKANDRLTSFERLEIYNRQYWFRLLDCLYEDYPGLKAALGDERFLKLITAYLVAHPSESPLLRELGGHLADFIAREPAWTQPYQEIALDMARLERAQVEAFDGASLPRLELADLAGQTPDRIFLRLQPYATLLALSHPVDEVVIRLLRKDAKLRGEASNAVEAPEHGHRRALGRRIKPGARKVLVHRQDNSVYFKPLDEGQFALLRALAAGESLAEACARVDGTPAGDIQAWFQNWAQLGLFGVEN